MIKLLPYEEFILYNFNLCANRAARLRMFESYKYDARGGYIDDFVQSLLWSDISEFALAARRLDDVSHHRSDLNGEKIPTYKFRSKSVLEIVNSSESINFRKLCNKVIHATIIYHINKTTKRDALFKKDFQVDDQLIEIYNDIINKEKVKYQIDPYIVLRASKDAVILKIEDINNIIDTWINSIEEHLSEHKIYVGSYDL